MFHINMSDIAITIKIIFWLLIFIIAIVYAFTGNKRGER